MNSFLKNVLGYIKGIMFEFLIITTFLLIILGVCFIIGGI